MNNIIEGMTILEQTMNLEISWIAYSIMILGVIIGIVFAWIFAFGGTSKNKKLRRSGFIGYMFGIIIMFAPLLPIFQIETGKYTYKCTLEDNISANYIEEHFNIISVENGIWTITDK